MLFNAGLIGILLAYINAKFSGVNQRFIGVDQRFVSIDQRFAASEQNLDRRFAAVDKRFDDLRDLWCAELHRFEKCLTPASNTWKSADIALVVNHSMA